MADDADSKQPQDKAWWDAWRLADFTWAGLAKRALAGWVVRDGVLMEEESGAVYGAAAASDEPPSALRAFSAAIAAPQRSLFASKPPAGGGRTATRQDYWRADPATGRLRHDDELIAAGELVLRPGAATPSSPQTEAEDRGEGAAAPLTARMVATLKTPIRTLLWRPSKAIDWPCGSWPRSNRSSPSRWCSFSAWLCATSSRSAREVGRCCREALEHRLLPW